MLKLSHSFSKNLGPYSQSIVVMVTLYMPPSKAAYTKEYRNCCLFHPELWTSLTLLLNAPVSRLQHTVRFPGDRDESIAAKPMQHTS